MNKSLNAVIIPSSSMVSSQFLRPSRASAHVSSFLRTIRKTSLASSTFSRPIKIFAFNNKGSSLKIMKVKNTSLSYKQYFSRLPSIAGFSNRELRKLLSVALFSPRTVLTAFFRPLIINFKEIFLKIYQ